MKKLILFLFAIGALNLYGQLKTMTPRGFLRDSSGQYVTVDFKKIGSSSLASGGATGQAIQDSINANAIGTQVSIYRIAYWANATDSLGSANISQIAGGSAINIDDSLTIAGVSVLTSVIIPFTLDSSYVNTSDTIVVGSFPYTMTVDSVKAVGKGVAANFNYSIGHSPNLTGALDTLLANSACTSITIGTKVTSFVDASSVVNAYYAVWFTSVTTKPKQVIITIYAHR